MVLGSVLAGLGALFLVVAVRSLIDSPGFGFDFACYVGGAERLVAGQNIYLPQNLEGPFRHGAANVYVYAPPLAVALAPLTALSFETAALVWLGLRIALLVAACALLPVPRHVRLLAFAVATFSSATLIDLNLGNVSVIVLFLLAVAWRWLDHPLGSIAVAVSTALRPMTGLLLLWQLVRAQRRAAAWTIGAGLVLIALTLPFVGLQGYLDFLRVVRNDQVAGVGHNAALESLGLVLGLSPAAALALHLGGVVVALGAAVASLRRDRELSFVVCTSASLLLAPLLWDHYLVSLVIPAAFLAARGRPWGILLPLLAWLPHEAQALPALAGLLLPFLARDVDSAEPQPITDLRGAALERAGG